MMMIICQYWYDGNRQSINNDIMISLILNIIVCVKRGNDIQCQRKLISNENIIVNNNERRKEANDNVARYHSNSFFENNHEKRNMWK